MRDFSSSDKPLSFSPRLRLPDAAVYLGISARSLADRGWRFKHSIPAIKVGRAVVFGRGALDRWLARHAERPTRTPEDPRDGDGGER